MGNIQGHKHEIDYGTNCGYMPEIICTKISNFKIVGTRLFIDFWPKFSF